MFDRQLAQSYYKLGTCCELRRISTVRQYSHETPANQSVLSLAQPRIEFRVIDFNVERGLQNIRHSSPVLNCFGTTTLVFPSSRAQGLTG